MDIKISEMQQVVQAELAPVKERDVGGDFSFTLNRVAEEGLAERLSGLIEDITAAGKKLADHMDISDMKKYRGLVSDFLNEVVNNSHKFSRENFLDRRGRHRVYGIVKLVNEELDTLAQEVLKKEKDRIKILDKIDEIRGLLLDVMI
ncbi:MAG: YaaR family protein [Clostridiales bacterium]|nr:YaaR family protein [Clostridiales bacterium]